MLVAKEYCRTELIVKGSRFIAEIFIVDNQKSAREKLLEVKKIYEDATHVVHAFITGKQGEVCGMSDDGEPSGTAGRPVLDVLKGSGITNVLLTVTRYFGGTLLGTGGLVHAYSDSAKSVLELVQTEELVEKKLFSFTSDYSTYTGIKRMFETYNIDSLEENYGEGVEVSGQIYSCQCEDFCNKIFNFSKGKITVETI